MTEEELHHCINSIADNNYFLLANRAPVDRALELLATHFDPSSEDSNFSLSLRYGEGGSKLSHCHSTQFSFVLQSLMLWREIMNDMFRLWFMTEDDLLDDSNRYRLMDTGQGLNRVQAAPNIGGAMSEILAKVHRAVKSWVGLSVVHLGDRDVPNALVFIDKYTQVPRILAPIVRAVDGIDRLCEDPAIRHMIDEQYDGPDSLKKEILCNYFKHGFDGSGSDGSTFVQVVLALMDDSRALGIGALRLRRKTSITSFSFVASLVLTEIIVHNE